MNTRKHPERAELYAKVRAEMETAPITEAFITSQDYHIDGFCDGGSKHVTINPQPGIVEAVIHELLHRLYPRWGERRVQREARSLLCAMKDRDVRAFYRQYQARKHERKSTVNLDAE